VVDSLKALDPEWPIREADIDEQVLALPRFRSLNWHDHITENLVGGWASAFRGTRCYESLRNPKSAGVILLVDAGFLDDRPPLLNLGLLQSAQRFRRLLRRFDDTLLPQGLVSASVSFGQVGAAAGEELQIVVALPILYSSCSMFGWFSSGHSITQRFSARLRAGLGGGGSRA